MHNQKGIEKGLTIDGKFGYMQKKPQRSYPKLKKGCKPSNGTLKKRKKERKRSDNFFHPNENNYEHKENLEQKLIFKKK